MAIDFWRQAISFSLEFPLTPFSVFFALLYIMGGAWFLWLRKADFAQLRGRRLWWYVTALVLVFPAQAFLVLYRKDVGVLPPAPIGVLPVTPALSLLGTAVVMAVVLWLGPGPGFVLGLVAGLAWVRFYPLTFTDLLALASWPAVVGWCVYQRYQGKLFDFLRRPILALPIFALVPIGLFSLSRLAMNLPPGILQAVDYLMAVWSDEVAVWLTGGLVLGVVFQSLFLNAAWRPHVQADKLSIYNRSLRARLLLTTIPLVLVIMVVSMLSVTLRAVRLAREQSLVQMDHSARNAREAITNFYTTGLHLLVAFSEDAALLDSQMRHRTLEIDRHVVPYFDELLLVNQNLEVIEVAPPSATLPSLTYEERVFAERALSFSWSGMTHLKEMGPQKYILTMVQPVRGAGSDATQAVLLGRVNLADNPFFKQTLKILQSTRRIGTGFVLDDRGLIIAHPNPDIVLRPWKASVDLSKDAALPQGSESQANVSPAGDGEELQGLYYDNIDSESGERTLTYILPATWIEDYHVILQLPFSSVLQSATGIASSLLVVQIMGGVILLFALPFFTSRIIKPLNHLSDAANHIAQGELDSPVEIFGEDEVAQLGRAFEQMRLRLRARLNDLSLLFDISQSVAATLDLERGVPPILSGALGETGAAVAHFILFSRDDQPEQVFSVGEDRSAYQGLDATFVQTFRRRRKCLIVDDLSQARGTADSAENLRSVAVFPVRVQHDTVGILWVGAYEVELFDEARTNFISTLASQAAFLVENARLFQSAEGGRRRLAAILSSTSDAILVIDASNLALTNPAAQQLLGLQEVDHGKLLSALKIPEALVEAFARSDEDGQPVTAEVPFEDGRTFLASVAAIMGAEGGPFGKVVVLRDVTHFKELDEMKSDFVTTVSHDLRAPLTFIRGYASMLMMVGELNEKQRDYLERILLGIDQMGALIGDLLNLRRIDAGVGIRQEVCRLGLILVEAVDVMRARGTTKGITLRLEPTEGAPVVIGDRTLLRQAVSNLVDNAIKYTPTGGQVSVGLDIVDQEVRIRITDNGIGISADDQIRLFEKFHRIKRRETGSIQGTGLGLALVKSIIERHEGRVWVESVVDMGSTFFVALPLPEEERVESG